MTEGLGLVGIVLVSHSAGLAEGAAELVRQISGGATVVPAGGTGDGGLGTSPDLIESAIGDADAGSGVLLIPDLGSAVLSARTVLADLSGEVTARLVDAPFVEGAVAAAVAAGSGADLDAVATAAEEARDAPKF
ncbi:dihydroxyacetone kinase phosphoryl donor subunit DhaM [Asanoa sp. WMMD1127]|uniref:dihydroxyacetone kinase phosphoryl donor subunit DhaM n=1 Tax=Asanoa sp. WMMD1127 TaxID=3016107 RepID=UPI002416F8D8|nr:dihydroxyacetone kinase phosphoryl donor subunit DhaM [Asanoa sp. WMMD1127]MDG4820536.1 dihydroxyacetone kinase phosphoryl donor subunit DhaM [Asanoa sp. WMMD1127]